MPSKGDDLDAAIACAITDHMSNVEFVYSNAGDTHPSNQSVAVPGTFNNAYLDASRGMSSSQPLLSFEDARLVNKIVKKGGQVGIVGGSEYTVAAVQPSGRGRTLVLLRKVDGA